MCVILVGIDVFISSKSGLLKDNPREKVLNRDRVAKLILCRKSLQIAAMYIKGHHLIR